MSDASVIVVPGLMACAAALVQVVAPRLLLRPGGWWAGWFAPNRTPSPQYGARAVRRIRAAGLVAFATLAIVVGLAIVHPELGFAPLLGLGSGGVLASAGVDMVLTGSDARRARTTGPRFSRGAASGLGGYLPISVWWLLAGAQVAYLGGLAAFGSLTPGLVGWGVGSLAVTVAGVLGARWLVAQPVAASDPADLDWAEHDRMRLVHYAALIGPFLALCLGANGPEAAIPVVVALRSGYPVAVLLLSGVILVVGTTRCQRRWGIADARVPVPTVTGG